MDRQPNRNPAKQRTIVDLKAKKRVRSIDDGILKILDQPQQKIPTLQNDKLNYHEGTHRDILELLKAVTPLENEGVFLKDKIPLKDEFYTETILSNGGFSKCIRLCTSNDTSFICKEVEAKRFYKNEVINMCQLNYINICQIYGLVRKPNEYHIYMEYCGINLYDVVKEASLYFSQIIDITKQLCMAVDFAHNNKIIHLDIKPENICLLFTPTGILLKLTDWGSSKQNDLSTEIKSFTYNYAAPEILYLHICKNMELSIYRGEILEKAIQVTQDFCHNYNSIDQVSTKSDSFSIGLTIIYVKNKKQLYNNQNLFKLSEMFAKNPEAVKELVPNSQDILTFIVKKLIEGESRKRISVKDVQKMISEHGQNNVYLNQDNNQDTNQSDNNMAELDNEEYNMPNFDMLF